MPLVWVLYRGLSSAGVGALQRSLLTHYLYYIVFVRKKQGAVTKMAAPDLREGRR